MRIVLAFTLAVGVLAVAGYFFFLPLLVAHRHAVFGGLGALLLLIAAVIPRRKPKCTGHHCSGCTDH